MSVWPIKGWAEWVGRRGLDPDAGPAAAWPWEGTRTENQRRQQSGA